MPKQVPINIELIAHTVVDREAVDRWVKALGAENFQIPEQEAVSDPALLIALAGKRCYMSFEEGLNPNVTRIRKDYDKYFDNIMASGHGSVLEHSTFTFALDGISRVFTAEMNRHRAGMAISEGSLRFIRFGEFIPYWVPTSIQGEDAVGALALKDLYNDMVSNDEDAVRLEFDSVESMSDGINQVHAAHWEDADPLEMRKQLSRLVFHEAFAHQERAYRMLQAIWADELKPESKFIGKKQVTSMMRRIVGLGVATGGVWTGNVRALRHIITMRAAPAAEEEILHVFSRIAKMMADAQPHLFGDFIEEDGFWRPKYNKV